MEASRVLSVAEFQGWPLQRDKLVDQGIIELEKGGCLVECRSAENSP